MRLSLFDTISLFELNRVENIVPHVNVRLGCKWMVVLLLITLVKSLIVQSIVVSLVATAKLLGPVL